MSTLKVTNLQHGSATAPAISVAVGGGATVLGITTFHNNVDLLDDDRLRLGAGQDLQIYHNSSNTNTYIQESGGGQLIVQTNAFRLLNAAGSENMIDADEDGAAKLYHNGSTRFETESGGAKVGGNDGVALTIDCPNAYSNSASLMMSQGRGEIKTTLDASGGNPGGTMSIRTRNTAGSLVESIRIENGQQVLINSVAGTHPLRVSNGGVERFRVASTGNVGVGTITPTGNFEVSGNDGLTVSNATRSGTNGAQWRLIPHNGGGSATNLRLYEGAGSTEVLNITKTGRIGVNRLTPSYMLDIVGNSSTGANAIRIVDGSESGHGSHPSKIVAGGTYYQEMQMHSRRFTVHTYDGSSIAERFRVHQDGTVVVGSGGNTRTGFFNSDSITPTLQIETGGPTDAGRMMSLVSNAGSSTGYCPTFIFGKTRGTTVDSNTGVANNDELGAVSFQGADGSHLVESARIVAEVASTTGTDNIPGRLRFHTNYGTSSPTLALEISKDQELIHYGSTGISGGPGGTTVTKRAAVSANGTLDIGIGGGVSYCGHLYVMSVYTLNATVRTSRIYFVSGRYGNSEVVTQLQTDNGASGGMAFTITSVSTGSSNLLRFTEGQGVPSTVSMHFVGAVGL